MKHKIVKRILLSFLTLCVVFVFLICLPRIWGAVLPGKPPVGYHFMFPTYVAMAVGLEKLVNTTPEVPETIEEIKDIEYKNINGKSLQLDIYKPRHLTQATPLLVFIHGGAWVGGKRSDYLVYLLDFAKKGYITATVSYRLVKDSLYPACAEDIRDAVHFLFNNGDKYGYDTGRIALVVGSAGAHLALLAAYGWSKPGTATDSAFNHHRIKAVVDIYGPVDFTTPFAKNNATVIRFLGHRYEEAPQLYTEVSPITYVENRDPPTLIIHGTSDKTVPIHQSDELKKKLDSLGVLNEYVRLPLWPHTMDLDKRVNDYCQEQMNRFFEKHLK